MAGELAGLHVLVTRPAGQGEALCAAIRARGGEAVALPMIEIVPLGPGDEAAAAIDAALRSLADVDVAIFVSTNAVRQCFARLRAAALEWPARTRCFAIGPATAAALGQEGVRAPSGIVATNSEELLERAELQVLRGQRVLLLKGVGGRDLLAARLRERGATVTECALYRRATPPVDPGALAELVRAQAIDVFHASSGEGLENLLGLLRRMPAGTIVPHAVFVVPGARVARLAAGVAPAAVEIAANAGDAAMLAALERVAQARRARAESS